MSTVTKCPLEKCSVAHFSPTFPKSGRPFFVLFRKVFPLLSIGLVSGSHDAVCGSMETSGKASSEEPHLLLELLLLPLRQPVEGSHGHPEHTVELLWREVALGQGEEEEEEGSRRWRRGSEEEKEEMRRSRGGGGRGGGDEERRKRRRRKKKIYFIDP